MSNAEKMVSEDLIRAILGNAAQGYFSKDHGDQLRAILDQPAQQGQGDPVAFLCTKEDRSDWRQVMPADHEYLDSWRANPKISVTPLYLHADPAEK